MALYGIVTVYMEHGFLLSGTEQVHLAVTLWMSVRELPVWNFGPDIGHLD